MGSFGCLTEVESGPEDKVDAPGVKTSVPMSETDSVSDFYYILKFSSQTIKKSPNFVEKIYFLRN